MKAILPSSRFVAKAALVGQRYFFSHSRAGGSLLLAYLREVFAVGDSTDHFSGFPPARE